MERRAKQIPDSIEEARNKEVVIDGQKIVFKERVTLMPSKSLQSKNLADVA